LYYNGDGAEADAISDAAFDGLERRASLVARTFPRLAARFPSRAARVGAPSPRAADATAAGAEAAAGKRATPKTLASGSSPSSSSASSSGGSSSSSSSGGGGGGALAAASPHLAPMLSLDNALTEAELRQWLGRLGRKLALCRPAGRPAGNSSDVHLVGEPKIDGLSLSLRCTREKRKKERENTNPRGRL
jgi:NAD-dependent DNA ligase